MTITCGPRKSVYNSSHTARGDKYAAVEMYTELYQILLITRELRDYSFRHSQTAPPTLVLPTAACTPSSSTSLEESAVNHAYEVWL